MQKHSIWKWWELTNTVLTTHKTIKRMYVPMTETAWGLVHHVNNVVISGLSFPCRSRKTIIYVKEMILNQNLRNLKEIISFFPILRDIMWNQRA